MPPAAGSASCRRGQQRRRRAGRCACRIWRPGASRAGCAGSGCAGHADRAARGLCALGARRRRSDLVDPRRRCRGARCRPAGDRLQRLPTPVAGGGRRHPAAHRGLRRDLRHLRQCERRWQRFQGAVAPPGEARPGWKVLRVLGNLLELDGFDYASAQAGPRRTRGLCAMAWSRTTPARRRAAAQAPDLPTDGLMRVGNVPIYAVDQLVRAAPSLQRTPLAGGWNSVAAPGRRGQARPGRRRSGRGQPGRGGGPVPVVIDDAWPWAAVGFPAACPGSEPRSQIGPIEVQVSSGDQRTGDA
jgi:hypothetical protein